MKECFLCSRDYKNVKEEMFGKGCLNQIYHFLNITKPKILKNKEEYLYNQIATKLNMEKLSLEQKQLLTDRYLTLEYLKNTTYGDFKEIENEINQDIINIRKYKLFDELKTTKKISLSEAYKIYKENNKFINKITELKQKKFIDEKDIVKFIIANFKIIFLTIKNKSQYQKNMFQEMQLAFWETVVVVGNDYFSYDLSAKLLQHSLEKNPQDMIIEDEEIIEKIKQDDNFKNKMNEIVNQYGKGCNSFEITDDDKQGFTFDNSDLYFSIHGVQVNLKARKNERDKWILDILLHDRYDYTDFKDFLQYYKDANSVQKSIFSSTIYNLAYYSVMFNVIKEYEIKINIDNYIL